MSSKKHGISSKAWLAFLFYLVIPLSSFLLILHSYPELSQNFLYVRIYWTFPIAIVIVILAQLSALYPKGNTKRYVLNIGFTVATMTWMFGLLGGGMVMTSQWNGYAFSLHMDKYVILIVCVALLNLLYYTLEWKVHRKEMIFHQSLKRRTAGTIFQ